MFKIKSLQLQVFYFEQPYTVFVIKNRDNKRYN